MTAPVLVGVDFSDQGRSAIAYAAWEASERGAGLRLVHGFQLPGYPAPFDEGLTESILQEARTELAALAESVHADHPALEVDAVLQPGSGAEVLVEQSHSAALAVVGSRGHGGFARLLIGSVAGQVAAHAACPVVVVRHRGDESGPTPVPGPGPVLVGVDGSTDALAAVAFGFAQAQARGVPLLAANIWAVSLVAGLSDGRDWSADADEWRREMAADAERLIAEAVAGHGEDYPDVEVRKLSVHGLPIAGVLLETAAAQEAGLIVVGSRGVGGFRGLLLGSVSQQVVNHADRPVAVVPADRY